MIKFAVVGGNVQVTQDDEARHSSACALSLGGHLDSNMSDLP